MSLAFITYVNKHSTVTFNKQIGLNGFNKGLNGKLLFILDKKGQRAYLLVVNLL